jgi:hypothetical protein
VNRQSDVRYTPAWPNGLSPITERLSCDLYDFNNALSVLDGENGVGRKGDLRASFSVLPYVDIDPSEETPSRRFSFSLSPKKLVTNVLGYVLAWSTRAPRVPPAPWLVHRSIIHLHSASQGPPALTRDLPRWRYHPFLGARRVWTLPARCDLVCPRVGRLAVVDRMHVGS